MSLHCYPIVTVNSLFLQIVPQPKFIKAGYTETPLQDIKISKFFSSFGLTALSCPKFGESILQQGFSINRISCFENGFSTAKVDLSLFLLFNFLKLMNRLFRISKLNLLSCLMLQKFSIRQKVCTTLPQASTLCAKNLTVV